MDVTQLLSNGKTWTHRKNSWKLTCMQSSVASAVSLFLYSSKVVLTDVTFSDPIRPTSFWCSLPIIHLPNSLRIKGWLSSLNWTVCRITTDHAHHDAFFPPSIFIQLQSYIEILNLETCSSTQIVNWRYAILDWQGVSKLIQLLLKLPIKASWPNMLPLGGIVPPRSCSAFKIILLLVSSIFVSSLNLGRVSSDDFFFFFSF